MSAGQDISAQPGFKPYRYGATTGTPSKADPAKVANAARSGVTEADRRPRPPREDDLSDLVRTRSPQAAADPLAAFALHLKLRMRALGWDQAKLQEVLDISGHIAGRAVNGTAVDLGMAGRIAAAVGRELTEMLGEYECGNCQGIPPGGFTCQECGAEGARI